MHNVSTRSVSIRDHSSDAKCTLVIKCAQDEKHLSLFLYRAQNLPSLLFLSTNITLSTLVILALCRTCVIHELRSPWNLYGSVVEHRSAESERLRFDSSCGLRIYSLSHARDKTKNNIFLHSFTELKTYHLSYSIYKGLIIPLLFSVFSILILVCELHPTALSVYRIHHIGCTRKTKTTRTKPFKCYLRSFVLENSLLQKSNVINVTKKINVWIVQCG